MHHYILYFFQAIKIRSILTQLLLKNHGSFNKKNLMIPHQLQLKNFLSYGPETQVIDFSNYHLICLSGKNGHGKSAMLDAITWAIWGQARKSSGNSKPDAGLLHLGQKHMMVILEFEVNGQHYRIRREYLNTASKPFATLDFGVKSTDGKLTALTDKTIKDTQEKIERTIGITYESFTNSTFLRQGQSNEFSTKSPKERKEILAQILQLQKFENQKKIALLHARKLQQDFIGQCNIKERIDQELINLASTQQDYAIIQENLKQSEQQRQKVVTEKTTLTARFQEIQKQLHQQIFLTHQKDELEKNITQIAQDISAMEQFLQQQPPSIDPATLKIEEQKTIALIAKLQQAHQTKLQLKENYLTTKEKLNEAVNSITQRYQIEQQSLQVQFAKYQEALILTHKQLETEQATQKKLQTELTNAQQKVTKLNQELQPLLNIKQELQIAQELFEKNKLEYQNLCSQTTQLQQQLNNLAQEQHELYHNVQDSCLLCMQPISQEQQQAIIQKLRAQQQETEQNLATTKSHIQNLKNILSLEHADLQKTRQNYELFIAQEAQQHEQVLQLEKLTTQAKAQTMVVTTYHEQIIELQNTQQTILTQLQSAKNAFEQQLNSYDLVQLKQTLQLIESQGKELNFQISDLQNAEQKLTEIRQTLDKYHARTDASAKQAKQAELVQLRKNKTIAQEQLTALINKLALFLPLEQQQKELLAHEQAQNQILENLEIAHRQMLITKGSLEQKQKKQADLEVEQTAIVISIKSLQQELTDYQEIAKALGKDGIQALLIEQAIPEIEHETNQILARLTNNQTQIFIESLRDLKKGGSKETLDIKISDSFGLRDYEMFSGGEAFRIDFALRIGISKLLARRAGTTLQTIFIDEGFGSQDEEGLQLIMDNIYKIQDDFAKIIIVSHLPEMKEQFPVQFIIEKKRCGSTVSVIHQG